MSTYQELMGFWATTGFTDFANSCHDSQGKFCETAGTPGHEGHPSGAGQPSDVVKIYGDYPTHKAARSAVTAIEQVHGLPKELYRPVHFKITSSESINGEYSAGLFNSDPGTIDVSSKGDHPELTFTHEFAHYVDHQSYINRNDVLPTIKASFDYKQLESEKGHEMGYVDYLLNDKETFARAYAQYVATRSGNEKLQGQVESIRNEFGAKHNSQWDQKDFEPIAEAFDKAFQDKGLLKAKQAINAAATLTALSNDCHDSAGRFCGPEGGSQSTGFFHGTDEEFQPGDTLLPQAKTGNKKFLYANPKRAESVYMTDNPKEAAYYGKHVYEVDPGEVRPDPEEVNAYMAPSARIIRKLPPKSKGSTEWTALPFEFANDCHDSATGRFCETGGGYQPDPTAPNEGEYVMQDGNALSWRQSHQRLVHDALSSWKGDPVDMFLHMSYAKKNDPQPSSGGGKQRRAQAEALLWEIHHNGRPNTKALYRGAETDPNGLEGWSELKSVAKGFQKKGQNAKLYTIPKGQAQGIRIEDYVHSQMTTAEREWIIDSTGRSPVLASAAEQLEFANQCHDAQGRFCEAGPGGKAAEISPAWEKAVKNASPNPTQYGSYWLLPNGDYAFAGKSHETVFEHPTQSNAAYEAFATKTNTVRIHNGDDSLEISAYHPMTNDQIESLSFQTKPYVAMEATTVIGPTYTEDLRNPTPDEITNALRRVNKAAKGEEVSRPKTSFANDCHDEQGRFCEGTGTAEPRRDALEVAILEHSPSYHAVDFHNMTPEEGQRFKDALDIINTVHQLPEGLPDAHLMIDKGLEKNVGGTYSEDSGLLRINPQDLDKMGQLNFIHEFGHHLSLADGGLIYPSTGHNNKLGTKFLEKLGQNDLGNWYYQTVQSKAFKNQFQREGQGDDYASYLKNPKELFARSYTQWIVSHSSDQTLKTRFDSWRTRGEASDIQWTDEDFKPIGKALDEYFSAKHLTASAATASDFANDCHDTQGRFCEGTATATATATATPDDGPVLLGEIDDSNPSGARALRQALKSIEALQHIPGDLPTVLVKEGGTGPAQGLYTPEETTIRLEDAHDQFSFVHEFGHHLTMNGESPDENTVSHFLGKALDLGLNDVLLAITRSDAIGRVSDRATSPVSDHLTENNKAYAEYLNRPHERFARAYAQYVASNSGRNNPALYDQFQRSRFKGDSNDNQWTDTDFEPIAKAFDQYFASNALKASAILEFANPCHDVKGEFCETTGGQKLQRASDVEQALALKRAKAKIRNAEVPPKDKVLKHRQALAKAEAEGSRAGGEFRGNSADRKRRQLNLWEEFNGPAKGYVVDAATGVKMSWTKDPKENPSHLPVFTQGKIFTGHQGGSYTADNLIPELLQSNQARGDAPVRKENLN